MSLLRRQCRNIQATKNYDAVRLSGPEKHADAAGAQPIWVEAPRVVINRVSTALQNILNIRTLVRDNGAGKRRSTGRYAALDRAVNSGLQEGDLGFAIERPQRQFQQLGPKPGFPDRSDRGTFSLVPGYVEAIV